MSNQLLNKYAEIISYLKASNGIKVVSVEEINDNEIFLRLKDSFESYFSEISETQLPLLILMDKIFTAVEMKSGYKLKVHNYLFFELPDGSHFRFSPYGPDGLEISRIWVNPQHLNGGLGSAMMDMFFQYLMDSIGYIPPLFLECTGSVGLGDNAQVTTISKQTNFFRKFGFRVKDGKNYPSYVSMSRPKEEKQFLGIFDSEELNQE
jgi:GNAT superfamily N-acetyltransferase